MYQLGEIGMFQMENLIRNKVPFQLFLIGASKPSNIEKAPALLQNLWSKTYEVSQQDALGQIQAMSLERQAPIIFAAEEAHVAEILAGELTSSGYANCFFLGLSWEETLRGLESLSF